MRRSVNRSVKRRVKRSVKRSVKRRVKLSKKFFLFALVAAVVLPGVSGCAVDADNILRVGVGSSGAFPGLFLATHSEDSFDSSINALVNHDLVSVDERNLISNNGIATFFFDREENAVVLQMQHDVYWHDGVPLTLCDLVFAYEIIAHADYTGIRFDASNFIPNVRGVEEFRAGTADYIAGLVLSDDKRNLRIYYNEPLPPSVLFAGGVWLSPVPRHHLLPAIKEVGHKNLQNHPRARRELLGFGAFIIQKIVPGESVFLAANENFFRGAPLVDGILVEIRPVDMISAAMRAGQFDIAAYQAANFSEFELMQPENYRLYAFPAASATFLNFRLGGMGEDGAYLREDGHPITNREIRRAMAYAVDRQTLSDTVGNGLWMPATSVLHPYNAGEFMATQADNNYFTFDLNLANQILDDAGFTQRDAEGYRLNLDGKPMTFMYGQHENPTHRVLVPLNIQNWQKIGLRVQMYEGDFLDWGLFTDIVIGEKPGPIEIFAMSWGLGVNPAPHGLWGEKSLFNMPRYTADTFRQILAEMNSDAAWDTDFLTEAYRRWETAFFDEVPAIPLTWNLDLVAVNNRVQNFSRERVDTGLNIPGNMGPSSFGSHLIGVS